MATTADLQDDLSVGMTEVRRTLDHYSLGKWNEYLLIRQPGKANSFVVLAHPSDKSDFQERLIEFHKAQAKQEASNQHDASSEQP